MHAAIIQIFMHLIKALSWNRNHPQSLSEVSVLNLIAFMTVARSSCYCSWICDQIDLSINSHVKEAKGSIHISYTFCCVVSLSTFTSYAVFWRARIQTTSKNSQRYYTTKRLKRDLLSIYYVRAGEFRGYLFTGNAWPKYAKRNGIGARNPTDWSTAGNLSTGSLEYKYLVIFVLVLGVICTLRSAVG